MAGRWHQRPCADQVPDIDCTAAFAAVQVIAVLSDSRMLSFLRAATEDAGPGAARVYCAWDLVESAVVTGGVDDADHDCVNGRSRLSRPSMKAVCTPGSGFSTKLGSSRRSVERLLLSDVR